MAEGSDMLQRHAPFRGGEGGSISGYVLNPNADGEEEEMTPMMNP
jgi:hypothetical protein